MPEAPTTEPWKGTPPVPMPLRPGAAPEAYMAKIAEGDERRPMALVNPEIVWSSDELATAEEGCLSLPEQFADVTRPAAVRFKFTTEQGEVLELSAEGLLARCVQHEIDHLDGILFVDHLSALRRNIILRRVAKARRARA